MVCNKLQIHFKKYFTYVLQSAADMKYRDIYFRKFCFIPTPFPIRRWTVSSRAATDSCKMFIVAAGHTAYFYLTLCCKPNFHELITVFSRR
jgi:hypothetical protein